MARVRQLDPGRAARGALAATGGSGTAAPTEARRGDYRLIGIDKVPFSKNQIVKFRQQVSDIPVYGSIVSVELDADNNLVSVDSTLGEPSGVDPFAKIAPAQVIASVRDWAGYGTQALSTQPRLNFFYDSAGERWRLVYIVEDVELLRARAPENGAHEEGLTRYVDFVVDADSGERVAELPRTKNAEVDAFDEAPDLLGRQCRFRITIEETTNGRKLVDRECNIHTHDFTFRDIISQHSSLPGAYVSTPPGPWSPEAVSAHANTRRVADFLLDVLERNGIDGNGGKIISSVNCLKMGDTTGQEWRNAARLPTQMVYGQRMVGGALRSYASSLEIVAHELLHGMTDATARLEYRNQSGALNESYSDIFGVIVANIQQPDIGQWEWRIGDEMRDAGESMRNMADPPKCGQPGHMDDYLDLPESEDHGGVHKNSGIHNKAAYNVLNAKAAGGGFLFTPEEVARIFYVTLASRLSRTSEFVDSRRGVLTSTRNMFSGDPTRDERLAAISKAFDDAGIVDPPIG